MKIIPLSICLLLSAVLPAQVLVQIAATSISCAGRSDGKLELTLQAGTLPVNFQWINLNNNAQGVGQFAALNQPLPLTGLPVGLYRFTFTDALGADTTLQLPIAEPAPLQGKLLSLGAAAGFQLACAADQTGIVQVEAMGGTPPMTFSWSNGDKGVRADSLGAGAISVTITDTRGCLLHLDSLLTAPPAITAQFETAGETCFGQNSGQISITSVDGGVPPYRFALNNNVPGNQAAWNQLAHGPYFVHITDAAGCRYTAGVVLPGGVQLTLDLGPDTTLFTGDTLRLLPVVAPPADSFVWTPPAGVLKSSNEEMLLLPPYSGVYELRAISAGGCVALDEIRITVTRKRDIYLPNVFAPAAQNAENRSFAVYGSAGILEVARLSVYDRFGRLWFDRRHLPVNDPAAGWDGADGRDEAPPGVYLWRAELRFTDGREERLMGDVTLVR